MKALAEGYHAALPHELGRYRSKVDIVTTSHMPRWFISTRPSDYVFSKIIWASSAGLEKKEEWLVSMLMIFAPGTSAAI